MKKLFLLVLGGLLAAPAILAAAAFEGRVTMKMTTTRGGPSQMTFSLKEGYSRIDMANNGRAAAVIIDGAKQQSTILMPEQKMYMTRPIPKLPAATGEAAGGGGTVPEVTTTKETILGYDCVKYVAQGKEGTTEVWVTDQLGAFLGMGGGSPMGGGRGAAMAAQGWEQTLLGRAVFPLRVVTTAGGKETFRMEATAVEKVELPASTFAAPADYRDIGAMMQGMPGMPPGMKIPGSP